MQALSHLKVDANGEVHAWGLYFNSPCVPDDPRKVIVSELAKFLCEKNQVYLPNPHEVAQTGFVRFYFKTLEAEIPVQEFASVLQAEPATVLSSLGMSVHHALLRLLGPKHRLADKFEVHLEGYEPITPLRCLKANFIDKFVAVRGNVVRVGNIKPLVLAMSFSCARCGLRVSRTFEEGRYEAPVACEGKCKSRSFLPDRSSALAVDWQKIKIQEIVSGEQVDQGRIPRTIECELRGALVDGCIPGDIVTIAGTIKAMKVAGSCPGMQKSLFVLYVDVNCIENGNKNQNSKLDVFKFTRNDYKMVEAVSSSPDVFKLLVHSLCPTIYGHELVKAGLLLTVFGGCIRHSGNNQKVTVRGDPHVLIVGDPGLGKSQLLRAVSSITPRGLYVCGNTTTSSGLTVTMVRDGKNGEFVLEAGALVLADQGCCSVDEFDKMQSEHSSLLEAMEQQSISIAKAGIVCSLAARTSIVAAANPAGGHYQRTRTVAENLKISSPLLSRFDIIFILLDKPDPERDQLLSEHVLALHAPRGEQGALKYEADGDEVEVKSADNFEKPLSLRLRLSGREQRQLECVPHPLLRKYIAYARKYCHPKLSPEAKAVLRAFYLKLRAEHQTLDSTPISTRQLESMIRLAEARAKAELRETVSRQDAQDVVDIMKEALLDVFSDDLGLMDFRTRGVMTKNKQIKVFMKALTSFCARRQSNICTYDELYKLAQDLNLGIERFEFFVDTLNHQSYLLQKGNRKYQVMTSE
jgi:DNA helicase MCM8